MFETFLVLVGVSGFILGSLAFAPLWKREAFAVLNDYLTNHNNMWRLTQLVTNPMVGLLTVAIFALLINITSSLPWWLLTGGVGQLLGSMWYKDWLTYKN